MMTANGGEDLTDITTTEQLRAIYRPPVRRAVDKQHAVIDHHDRAFIAHAPFVIVATSAADGSCDVSPKGGPPGFVTVLDDGTVVVPDLKGNHRLDSMQNLLTNDGIALLFLIPGRDETLRVNGRARLTTDPDTVAAASIGDVVANVAIAIAVAEVYVHCAKALRRGSVWEPEAWPDTSDMATAACMLRDQALPDENVDDLARAIDAANSVQLWQAGGTDG